MPRTFAQVYVERRQAAAARGWATPPHTPAQREQRSWLDYWTALEHRATSEGWPAHSCNSAETQRTLTP